MKLLVIALLFSLTACVSIKQPEQPPAAKMNLEVIKHFPGTMPKGSARFEDTQIFFVHADQASAFAAGLLVPIPFVTDMVVESSKNDTAKGYEQAYRSLSVYDITVKELQLYDGIKAGTDGYQLYPMIFIEDCYDGVYRLSMAYQLERGEWLGRYYFHLQETIPREFIGAPSAEVLQAISLQMQIGARQLLGMIERDVNGNLTGTGDKATVGSLYIVGSKVSGLVDAEVLKYKHAEVVENTDTSVIVKLAGDPKGKAKAGGLAYGTHFFYKDQLHTFELED